MLFNQVTQMMGDPPRPVSDPDFSGVRMVVGEDHENKYGVPSLEKMGRLMNFYFIVRGEISVYLVKIKVVSITSELISYHFTSD